VISPSVSTAKPLGAVTLVGKVELDTSTDEPEIVVGSVVGKDTTFDDIVIDRK
jgi:hypothetical protein